MVGQFTSPRLTKVRAGENFSLITYWEDGSKHVIDLSSVINKYKIYRRIRNPVDFANVKVDDFGWSVRWSKSIDISAQRLWELAQNA